MPTKQHYRSNPFRVDDYLCVVDPPWTRIQRALHREIYSWGIKSCYKSNATLARNLRCCVRSIRSARSRLACEKQIFIIRQMPHTWSAWSVHNPSLKTKPFLFFGGGEPIENPYYRPSTPARGGQLLPVRGAIVAPNSVFKKELLCSSILESNPTAETAAPPVKKSQGASPPNPPAVQGTKSAKKSAASIPPGQNTRYDSCKKFVTMMKKERYPERLILKKYKAIFGSDLIKKVLQELQNNT